jgi:hypothetical protein
MSAHNNPDPIAFFKEGFESVEKRARGIANQQPGCQVDHLRSILHHFFPCGFNIASRAPVTSGVAHELNYRIGILGECAFPISHRPQAFPASAGSIAVANNDSDLHFGVHFFLLYQAGSSSLFSVFQA